MSKIIVRPTGAAPTIGPYNLGVRAGNLLYCAGQIPVDPQTGHIMQGSVHEQTKRVLENVKIILEDQGLNFSHVIKTTVFMTDLGEFTAMNEIYALYFTEDHPARSTVQVVALPRGAKVEIEVIAQYD